VGPDFGAQCSIPPAGFRVHETGLNALGFVVHGLRLRVKVKGFWFLVSGFWFMVCG